MKKWSLQSFLTAILFASPVVAQDDGIDGAVQAGVSDAMEAVMSSQATQDDTNAGADSTLDPEMRDVFDRGCGDDRGQDRCSDNLQSKMRKMYGLEPIEALAEAGSAVYRAMFVDGYGNDVVSVSFIRERGRAPYVDVRAPSSEPESEQLLQTNISADRWATISGRSPAFDEMLAHEMADDGGLLRVCLHGWFVVVESAEQKAPFVSTTIRNSEDGNRTPERIIERPDPLIRRDAEGACADGLAVPFAFDLAKEAVEALVECSNLSLDDFRNTAMLLAACHRLQGDRLTAANARVTVEKLQSFPSDPENDEFSLLFVSTEKQAPRQYLADIEGAAVFYSAPRAVSTTDVVVEGKMYYFGRGEEELPTEQATITVNLHEYGSFFSVFSWRTSEKVPFVMPEGLER